VGTTAITCSDSKRAITSRRRLSIVFFNVRSCPDTQTAASTSCANRAVPWGQCACQPIAAMISPEAPACTLFGGSRSPCSSAPRSAPSLPNNASACHDPLFRPRSTSSAICLCHGVVSAAACTLFRISQVSVAKTPKWTTY
jgi:hypothetical protein